MRLILTIVQLVLAVVMVGVVLLQQSRRTGISGTISGAADTFLSKNKSQSLDARLAKITVIVAALFIILTIVLSSGLVNK